MNERIRKLDKAAQKYAGSIVGNNEDSNETEWFNTYKEKFAQLIVLECLGDVEDIVRTRDSNQYYCDPDSIRIKSYFGITK
jgi:hypothetical protein